jgi:hypothetical protein
MNKHLLYEPTAGGECNVCGMVLVFYDLLKKRNIPTNFPTKISLQSKIVLFSFFK